ncbi:hypothetical protein Tco_0411561 [Tanacetum coccineum]
MRFVLPLSFRDSCEKEASPAGPTLKCPQTTSPHQAASIAKCSAMKQDLPNTTDAEAEKPEVAKEVGGRKYLGERVRMSGEDSDEVGEE